MIMIRRKSLASFLCLRFMCSCVFAAPDSQGTEFILGFMENKPLTTDIELFITTVSESPATVTITLPKFNSSWTEVIEVTRGHVQKVTLPMELRGQGIEKSNKGAWIQATKEVSVCAVNKEPRSADAYISLPVDVLSTEYYAMTYTKDAALMVVATDDVTEVKVHWPLNAAALEIPYDGAVYRNGDTLTVTMDKFETFHVFKEDNQADFTGVRITSTKPVAVLSGNRKVAVPVESGTADHLTEMVMPVDTWGKTFITTSTPDRSIGDLFRIVTSQDATTVTLSNGTSYVISRAGDFLELDIATGDYQKISSDKPAMLAMFAKTFQKDGPNYGDPAMSIDIPETQYASDYTWSSVQEPRGDEFNNKVAVVIDKTKKDGLLLDGQSITWEEEKEIQGAEFKVHLWTRVTPGYHNLYHTDPTVTFLALVSGSFKVNSYAFSAGLRLAKINAPCEKTAPVAGDIIDNDCDGLVDEETLNGIDDDGDGAIDEDLAAPPRSGMTSSNNTDLSSFNDTTTNVTASTENVSIGDMATDSQIPSPTDDTNGSETSSSSDVTNNTQTPSPNDIVTYPEMSASRNVTTSTQNPSYKNDTTYSETPSSSDITTNVGSNVTKNDVTFDQENVTSSSENPVYLSVNSSASVTNEPESNVTTDSGFSHEDDRSDDGSWGPWSEWGECNGTCGEKTGVRFRHRNCSHPAYTLPDAASTEDDPSAGCDGAAVESQTCGMPPCPSSRSSGVTDVEKTGVIVGVVTAIVALTIATTAACCCILIPLINRRRRDDDEEEKRIPERSDEEGYEENGGYGSFVSTPAW